MAAAEALMELVPSGHSRRGASQANGATPENEEDKERVMAATYAAYTKRARLQADKTKAQQLSRQLKTRLQFAQLKVDYGWTRQSLNEVENLYFHLSRARPAHQPHTTQREATVTGESFGAGPSTPPTALATPVESQEDQVFSAESLFPRSTQFESSLSGSSQPPGASTSPESSILHSISQPLLSQQSAPSVKRSPLVERTRTGGIVRSAQPVERLRTGGKVKSAPAGLSPKKRGRPRIPDASEPAVVVPPAAHTAGVMGADGGLTYDSFWNSLGTAKSPGS